MSGLGRNPHVTGVLTDDGEHVAADLVIDASGRRSAFAESASWNGVIQRLHAYGYPVIAVGNPLRSLCRLP